METAPPSRLAAPDCLAWTRRLWQPSRPRPIAGQRGTERPAGQPRAPAAAAAGPGTAHSLARCLTLSGSALVKWWDTSVARQAVSAGTQWNGSAAAAALAERAASVAADRSYEVAQLDLLASRSSARWHPKLIAAHEKEATRLVLLKPGEDDYEHRAQKRETIIGLQRVLVERARTDLGLDRPRRRPAASWASFSHARMSDGHPDPAQSYRWPGYDREGNPGAAARSASHRRQRAAVH